MDQFNRRIGSSSDGEHYIVGRMRQLQGKSPLSWCISKSCYQCIEAPETNSMMIQFECTRKMTIQMGYRVSGSVKLGISSGQGVHKILLSAQSDEVEGRD